ncbi:MAG: methyltransferase [Bacteroidetes bacterium 46-16]|nr:MAG: methyltransferase [Bacteroidetes bacterium 46-16]
MSVTPTKELKLFSTDKLSAFDAISRAQFIAFAPYIFQAAVLLRDQGILRHIELSGKDGTSIDELAAGLPLTNYALRVLLEAGLGIGLVYRLDDKYFLAKTGHFFLNDQMTRVNTDFMRDVCYDGAQELASSLEESRPAGLHHLGNWATIYEGLSRLPEPARTSWFRFDHFYSDNAFPEALPIVFDRAPGKIMDIGANTGKWTLACLDYDKNVELCLVDLGVQLQVAKKNIEEEGHAGRVQYYECNVLEDGAVLPGGFDVIWMSQFLDCFSDEQIVSILKKCYKALPTDGSVFINETFWDRQRFEASALSLQMTSLYFTTMANGNSQMYDSDVFMKLIAEAGFEVVKQINNIGLGHTLLELKKL